MEAETKLMLIAFVGTLLFMTFVIGLWIYSIINPTQTKQFLQQYGIIVAVVMIGIALFGAGYIHGWWKALKIVIYDYIEGGGFLGGILKGDPIEVNIRSVLGKELPDAQITFIPLSIGRSTLLPVSKEKGTGWNAYANVSGKLMTFYGTRTTIDKFLCDVYGLDPKIPNDLRRLEELLKKVNVSRIKKYELFHPYENTALLVKAKQGSITPVESAMMLEVLRQQRMHYQSLFKNLIERFGSSVRGLAKTAEDFGEYIWQVGEAGMKSMANPARIVGRQAGIPAERVVRSGVPTLMESAPTQEEVASMVREQIVRPAEAYGYTVVPKEEYEELKRMREQWQKTFGQGIQIIPPAPSKEEIAKEVVKKAEGKS